MADNLLHISIRIFLIFLWILRTLAAVPWLFNEFSIHSFLTPQTAREEGSSRPGVNLIGKKLGGGVNGFLHVNIGEQSLWALYEAYRLCVHFEDLFSPFFPAFPPHSKHLKWVKSYLRSTVHCTLRNRYIICLNLNFELKSHSQGEEHQKNVRQSVSA